jgi:hypothetical protein
MKTTIAICSVFVAALALAQEPAKTNAPIKRRISRKLTPEEIAKEDEEYFRSTGGSIEVAPAGPAVTIVDMRKNPLPAAPDRVVKILGSMYRFPATNMVGKLEADSCPISVAESMRKSMKALMVILLVDGGKKMPSLTVCPEERVAIVNADKATQFATGTDADARLIKEMWRAVGFISGAGFSPNDTSVMQPVGSPLELDTVEWQVIHPSAYQNMSKFFKKYGVKRGHSVTYKKACLEGWAPAPTNDYQRAIFEAVKTNKADTASSPAATPPAK